MVIKCSKILDSSRLKNSVPKMAQIHYVYFFYTGKSCADLLCSSSVIFGAGVFLDVRVIVSDVTLTNGFIYQIMFRSLIFPNLQLHKQNLSTLFVFILIYLFQLFCSFSSLLL